MKGFSSILLLFCTYCVCMCICVRDMKGGENLLSDLNRGKLGGRNKSVNISSKPSSPFSSTSLQCGKDKSGNLKNSEYFECSPTELVACKEYKNDIKSGPIVNLQNKNASLLRSSSPAFITSSPLGMSSLCTAVKTSRSDSSLNSRKMVIGGNWKCNGSKEMAEEIVKRLNEHSNALSKHDNIEVVIAPPNLHVHYTFENLQNTYQTATQDVAPHTGYGAYTGQTSAQMIKNFGLNWTIVGHSERRQGFQQQGEDSQLVATKTKAAIQANLNVILCIGEQLEDREGGKTMNVLSDQLEAVRDILTPNEWEKVVIAYEPVWAIGTGKSATPEIAQNTHKQIRSWLEKYTTKTIAEKTRILYGGSVKGSNAQELIMEEDIDGFLVGGASLTDDFVAIMKAVESTYKPTPVTT